MQHELTAGLQIGAGQVGIQITAKQDDLKEEHRRGPHRRAAAKPRQDELADQRLYLEEQERAGEDRDGIGDDDRRAFGGRCFDGLNLRGSWRGSDLFHGPFLN